MVYLYSSLQRPSPLVVEAGQSPGPHSPKFFFIWNSGRSRSFVWPRKRAHCLGISRMKHICVNCCAIFFFVSSIIIKTNPVKTKLKPSEWSTCLIPRSGTPARSFALTKGLSILEVILLLFYSIRYPAVFYYTKWNKLMHTYTQD